MFICANIIPQLYIDFQNNKQISPSTCEDFSDRVFTVNQPCTEAKYVEIFNQTVCSEKVHRYFDDTTNCEDLKAFIRKNNSTDYWDPHHCRESCSDPGYGCLACTNPDYFHCTRNNTEVCIHPKLQCNHHPDCDNAVDENLDVCYDKYVKQGNIDEHATLRCHSKIYSTMETVASVCDGVVECQGDVDEPLRCRKNNGNTILASSVGFILFCYLGLKMFIHFKRNQTRKQSARKLEFILRIIESPETCINNLREKFNLYGLHVLHHYGKKTKRKVGLKIYLVETREKNTEAEIFLRLKNNYNPEIANFIIGSRFPGLVERFFPIIQDVKDYLSQFEKFHKVTHVAMKCWSIMSHYADSFKDGFILYLMVDLNGGWESLVNFPLKFSSVTIICMGTTLIGPLIASSLQLALNNPGLIFNSKKKDIWSVSLMRVGVLLLSVFIPILLNVAHENVEEEIREESKKPVGSSQLKELMEKKKKLKLELSKFTKTDLGFELIYQISIQLLLVLLNKTKTPTTGGLELLFEQASVFGLEGSTLIALTTFWSFKTCILLQRKAIKTEKGFLPFTSQLAIVFWSAIAAARRILTLIIFFLPSLGLFDLLTHWKAEQIPFSVRLEAVQKNILSSGDIIQLNNMSRNVPWTLVDRWQYNSTNPENNEAPHFRYYTGIDLGESFCVFLALSALQMFSLAIVKVLTVKNIKKERVFDVFIHILENLNFPFPYKDWDVDNQSTVDDYKKKLTEVNKEMAWSYCFNIPFNILMFTPFWWTGRINLIVNFVLCNYSLVHKITERHQLLEQTILPRDDETETYKRAQYLNNCLTPIFLTALVLETVLFYLYTNMVNCQ